MTDILSPPSPLAPYSSTAPPEYPEHYFPSAEFYASEHTSNSRGTTSAVPPRFEKNHIGGHFSVPPSYCTPPHTTVLKSSMLEHSRAGPLMAAQHHVPPRVTSTHPPHPAPQLPVPQPRVVYQPVSTVPVEALPKQEEHNSSDNAQIASYMQIPASINSSKGSLSEFAAQITCLFWFESIVNLQRVEDSASTPAPVTPLADDAKPTLGFRKWVTTMLSTTQVTQNVILLALMFIYRLKTQNPQVRGKAGSEYRLLTVALMLGNKFLDDNTYTNKTWADVSGISVAEIHVMEVEFLSNMRYALYTSQEDWHLWHKKLGRFYDYFDKASRSPQPRSKPSPLYPSPTTVTTRSPIPSPPNHMIHYNSVSRQISPPYSHQSTPLSRLPQFPPPTPEHMNQLPQLEIRPDSRKRTFDEVADQPPSKKFRGTAAESNGHIQGLSGPPASTSTPSFTENQTPRLPMPNFNHTPMSQAIPNPLHGATHLPPPQTRSMAMIYGQAGQQRNPPQLNIPHTMAPNGSRVSIPSIFDNNNGGHPLQLYPISTGSPSNLALTPTSHELLSPSAYPINRSSPYRPVRSVNTLLVPPPTASVQNAPQTVGTTNMHYQPIGKPPSERRTGVVPYMHHHHQERPSWTSSSSYHAHGY